MRERNREKARQLRRERLGEVRDRNVEEAMKKKIYWEVEREISVRMEAGWPVCDSGDGWCVEYGLFKLKVQGFSLRSYWSKSSSTSCYSHLRTLSWVWCVCVENPTLWGQNVPKKMEISEIFILVGTFFGADCKSYLVIFSGKKKIK